jgi:hypothetical protein
MMLLICIRNTCGSADIFINAYGGTARDAWHKRMACLRQSRSVILELKDSIIYPED